MIVVLDTNVLTSDPYFKSTEMVQLRDLCESGKIKLVLPDIVVNEFRTQQEEEIHKVGIPFVDKIRNRKTKSRYSSEIEKLEKAYVDAESTVAIIIASIKDRIDSFIGETRARITTNNEVDLKKMLDMYFSGDKPFRAIKKREDIPDCLIYLQAQSLDDSYICFISNDEKMRSALENIIYVFKNMNEFLESSTIKEILASTKVEEKLNVRIINQIKQNNGSMLLLLNSALEKELTSKTFIDENIPDDNNEGTINGIPSIDDIEIDSSSIKEIGNGIFTFGFSCKFETLIDYFIFISDYYCIDPERSKNISISEWNDHYYSAEEYMNVICTGIAGIKVNEDELVEVESDDELLDNIDVSFSDIELAISEE